MTWNPPPYFQYNDTPTLAEWNRYITSLDAIQTRFRPSLPAFVTRHNCFVQPVSENALQATHTIPLPVTLAVGSLVGLFAVIITSAISQYDARFEAFYFSGSPVSSSYTFTWGTLTYNVSGTGVFSITASVPVRYAGYSVVILP